MTRRFIGRDPATVAADMAVMQAALGDGFEAQPIWHALDRISRDEQASAFTRQRAHRAAVALGSILDDLAAADADNR